MNRWMQVTTPEMRRSAFRVQVVKDACGLLAVVALVLAIGIYG